MRVLWYKTKDGLPEPGETVLVYKPSAHKHKVFVAQYEVSNNYTTNGPVRSWVALPHTGTREPFEKITKWAKVPYPSTNQGEKNGSIRKQRNKGI